MLSRRSFLEISGSALVALDSAAALATPPSRGATLQGARDGVAAARAVLQRQFGHRATEFDLSLSPAPDGMDYFEVSASRGRVRIVASRPTSLCRGAYHYLRAACSVMISWSGRHADLPTVFPDFPVFRGKTPYKHLQYLNACTFGYTMPFWDWAKWERELDWMALRGITMPLALEGQELIWDRVWRWLGLTEAEIDAFSVGPAHQPWHRMGNINNMQGPLPTSFKQGRADLQRRIIERMRELGMDPIVPAFSGFVPQGFMRAFPKAKTSTLLWSPDKHKALPRSARTFILSPEERDLYKRIGERFIREYKAEFGEAHYYLADAYNEMTPPVREDHREEDLRNSARTVYEGIIAGDPNGVWVMQAWLFVHEPGFWNNESVAAYLSGVPDDRMLVLDYANDLTATNTAHYATSQWKTQKAFFGKPWMNGMILTFGGNDTVKGNLGLIATQPPSVLASADRGKLVAWGLCPEGTQNNEVAFELMTDMGWTDKPIDLDIWIPAYCRSRYGACPDAMREAWSLLRQSAFSTHIWKTKQAWQREPSDTPVALGVDAGTTFHRAVELFLSCAPELGHGELYRNDLIEFVVQAAGERVDTHLLLAVQALAAKQNEQALSHAKEAKALLYRMDGLLNLRPDRRLETFVASARQCAKSPDEATAYEINGRQLITTWGSPDLSDYACRVWSGLVRDYYTPRWMNWIESQVKGQRFSIEIWEWDWLSRPYVPSMPYHVDDIFTEARSLL